MLLIAVIALLLYGGDLPHVARSWGKTFAEFRRGLGGIQDEINSAMYSEPADPPRRLEHHPQYHDDAPGGDASSDVVLDAGDPPDDSQDVAEEGDGVEGRTLAANAEGASVKRPQPGDDMPAD